jgi:hypothetical protein
LKIEELRKIAEHHHEDIEHIAKYYNIKPEEMLEAIIRITIYARDKDSSIFKGFHEDNEKLQSLFEEVKESGQELGIFLKTFMGGLP